MSRIAGIRAERDEAESIGTDSMLADAVAGARRELNLETESARTPAGSIGWIGSAERGLWTGDGIACAVDGTIFNRSRLGGEETDAALVARLYRDRGLPGALTELNGDFAIALADGRTRTLWLARDRFGVRPLYYIYEPGRFAFASRPRPLLRLPGVSRAPDPRYLGLFAASHYRAFDNDPGASPYAAVSQLPAAHLVRVDEDGVELERWWELHPYDLDGSGPAELAERYRELLLDAVALRLGRSPRAAFTLSGGMDSSSVLASSVELTGEPQTAYSTLYEASEFDERDEIKPMLVDHVSDWRRVHVDEPDVAGLVERMIEAHDEPVATATWLSHFVLCDEVATDGAAQLFGGLGGDELNAGEYEYFLYRFADLRAAGDEETLAHEVEAWVSHHDHPIFRKSWESMEAGIERLVDLGTPGRILPDRGRLERYLPALRPEVFDLGAWEPVMDRPFPSYLLNRTYQDIFRETAPCCLRAEDRGTAAFGLRNRDPFFDHRLVELMFAVPGEQKIRDGVTKRLLRDATRGILPEETRTRVKKTGWNAPADQWFTGAGRELLVDLVSSGDFRAAEVYEIGEARRLIDEHEAIVASGEPRENHMMFLWQLLNLELWLRWLNRL